MTVLGHAITWGTHVGDERKTDAKSWYTQFKAWWADHGSPTFNRGVG